MLDRTALSKNRIGLFGMVAAGVLEHIADAAEAAPACSPAAAMGVYAQLAVIASQQGNASTAAGQWCAVAIGELAARCRMGRRTVQTYLALLDDAGVVEIRQNYDRGGRPLASTYVFRYPRRGTVPPAAQHSNTGTPDKTGHAAGVEMSPPGGSAAGGIQPKREQSDKEESSLALRVRGPEDARAYLDERRKRRALATDPATNTTSGAPALPVERPVGPAPIPVERPVPACPLPVPLPAVPVAAPAATGAARSPVEVAPIGSRPAPTETGSPAAVPPAGAGFPCGPVPAPPRPPERSGRPVRHPVPLSSLLGAFPVRPVGRPVRPPD